MPHANRSRGLAWSVVVIALAGLAARVIAFDHLPGINGDEAWYGANIEAWLAGQPVFWLTPSGNPINPLQSLPLGLLAMLFAPAPALLRLPETLWSVVAVAIAFPLLRGSIGSRPALIAAMLLAASPVATLCARLGWDPSGTPFITLIALGAAMLDRPLTAAILGVVALSVHPTNVFFLPILASAWLPSALRRYATATPSQRKRWNVVGAVFTFISAVVVLWLLRQAANNPSTPLPSIAIAIDRSLSLTAWLQLLGGIGHLYSGITTMTFVAGMPSLLVSWLASAVGATALLAFVIGRSPVHRYLLGGIAVSVMIFMAAAGPGALEPGFERYALFLVVPMIIVSALGIDSLPPRLGTAVAMSIAALMLALTVAGHFRPLMTTGGEGHIAFRTGPVEPKAAVAAFVRSQHDARAIVICPDWWSYWPLRYLLARDPGVSVAIADDASLPAGVRERLPQAPDRSGAAIYEVTFDDGGPGNRAPVFTAHDAARRPVLHVIRVN